MSTHVAMDCFGNTIQVGDILIPDRGEIERPKTAWVTVVGIDRTSVKLHHFKGHLYGTWNLSKETFLNSHWTLKPKEEQC